MKCDSLTPPLLDWKSLWELRDKYSGHFSSPQRYSVKDKLIGSIANSAIDFSEVPDWKNFSWLCCATPER
jgi:hypothetical protein